MRWLLVLFFPGCLTAAPIPGLFNSGVNTNGALLAPGSVDPHYRLIQSPDPSFPGPNAIVLNDSYPIGAWLPNGPNSKWVAPKEDESGGNSDGDYTYRIVFDLTGLDPTTAIINGVWTSDNNGIALRLNDITTGFANDGNFGALNSSFTITNGFVDGTNTLDFVLNNAPCGCANPTGLRVELNGTANPLPPPGTPPSILTPPASQTKAPGDTASFTASVYGAPPLSYQWRFNSQTIPGATNATYVIDAVSMTNAGSYSLVVSNPWGTATSSPPAVLTISYPSPAQLGYEAPGPSSRRTGLAITEIMYHPADRTDGRNLEFIEIYNSNPFQEDLSGYRISGDWNYTFPSGTIIPALGYRVVAPVPTDIQTVYGLGGVLGGFTNSLPNSSGSIRLTKRSGGVVLEINYSADVPWPVAADGAGHSLVLVRPSFGEQDSHAWAASAVIGGSPGAADPIPTGPLEHVLINEFLAHTDDPELDYVELYNHSALPVDISGCILTDDPATNKFVIPANTTIAPGGFLAFTQTNLTFSLDAAGETIYFKNAALTRVIDAVRFEAQENGVSMGRFPNGSDQFHRQTTKTPGAANTGIRVSQVVLNELMYHPISGNDDDQYVELYNRGTNSVNLGGWRLRGGISFDFSSNIVILPDSYLVIGRDISRLRTNYANLNASNSVGNFSGKLSHRGERVVLSIADTVVSTNQSIVQTNTIHITLDEVTYGTAGSWGRWAAGGGSSLELVDPHSNHRLPSNWADSDETAKSVWTPVEGTGVLDLGHPAVPSADELQVFLQGDGESLVDDVEVFATSGPNRLANPGFESGASGWSFQGTQRLTSWETNGGYSGARSLHVRASDRGDHIANRVRAPFTTAFSPGQTVTIRAKVRWLRGWPEMLFRLRGNYLETVGRLAVPKNLGTPGARNSQARTNAGPAIVNVTHRPILPLPSQNILVTAQIHDPDGLQSVQLKYRIDPAATVFTVNMVDNGANGDLLAGDGIYTGIIPGQSSGALVAFRVEARDNFATPATTLFPTDAPARECLVRVGESLPAGAFGTYRFWMTQASQDFWSARERMSNEYVNMTFVYGTNRVIYDAGARYSGSYYTTVTYNGPTGNLCGYSLAFPGDDLLLGEERVILDWPIRDDTDQREQLMYWFLDQLGLPNHYRRYIRLFVNGVARGTIYDDIQKPGGDSINEWFSGDSDGGLFKTDGWDEYNSDGERVGDPIILNTLENFTTSGGAKKTARYRWNWEPRTVRNTANDFSELFALVDAVNAPADGYQSAVEALVDMDQWMRTFCMDDLASFWDAFGNINNKNTFLYKPERDRWKLVSWDFDVGLGCFNDPPDYPLFPTLNDPAVMRIYATPALVRRYWGALNDALNSFFQTGSGTGIDTILDSKYAAFQANSIALNSPAGIKDWINQRRAFLQSQLATVAASFSVNGPTYFSTNQNSVVLSGFAPVNVQAITVNGLPYPITWTSVTAWRIVVPVKTGTNALSVQGLDRLNQPVAGTSRTITANFTGADEQPESFVVINEIMCQPSVANASYLELFNRSTNSTFDLSGWRLDGVDFDFPPGSLIAPQQFLVVAKDRLAFGSAHGWGIPIIGEFNGVLQPDGETLTLLKPGTNAASDQVITKVRYEATPPWPTNANGTGRSLQLIDAAQDNWRAGNWTTTASNTPVSPAPQWVYFSTTGTASGSVLYLYLQSAGDIYLDDLTMVAGSVPETGPNLIANPGFESTLTGPWSLTANFASSVTSTNFKHAGNSSLHLIATAAGAGSANAVYQNITPALVT
ncbi:MAG: lamin tail domain-containing protein, partial [Verrucomicrobiota bacterium]